MAPASLTAAIAWAMWSSEMPRVAGLVVISAAGSGPRAARRAAGPGAGGGGGRAIPAARVGRDRDRGVTDHGGGGRVRAVRAVGHEDPGALLTLTPRPMVGAGHQQAGPLTARAGGRLQADRGKPADLLQQLAQQPL